MKASILAPSDCSTDDLTAFAALVIAGGAVTPHGLDARIHAAFRLLFLRTPEGHLAGVAALKRPNIGYRSGVFQHASATVSADAYTTELGWIVVADSHRGQRLPLQLITHLLPHAGGERIFATTHSRAVQYALSDSGFQRDGVPYPSGQGDHNLILYVRES